MSKQQKNFELPGALLDEFEKRRKRLGMKSSEAAQSAVMCWLQATADQAKLPAYFPCENNLTIVKPQTVNIAVFRKAELVVAREELQRLLGVLERTQDAQFKHDTKVQLAQALKRFEPIYLITRDSELQELIKKVEATL